LENLENDTVVTKEMLVDMNLVKYPKKKIKILGNGDFTKKLEIHADAFSLSAKEKIEKAGGKAVLK
jgi:large subunit ribosomal protein L15